MWHNKCIAHRSGRDEHAPNSTIQCRAARSLSLSCACALCLEFALMLIFKHKHAPNSTIQCRAARSLSLSCACALCLEFALMLIFKHKHAPNSTIQCRAARSLSLSCVCWLGLEFGLMLIVLHTLSLRTHYEKNIKMADGAGWCAVMGAECGPGCCGNCAHGQGGTDLPHI